MDVKDLRLIVVHRRREGLGVDLHGVQYIMHHDQVDRFVAAMVDSGYTRGELRRPDPNTAKDLWYITSERLSDEPTSCYWTSVTQEDDEHAAKIFQKGLPVEIWTHPNLKRMQDEEDERMRRYTAEIAAEK